MRTSIDYSGGVNDEPRFTFKLVEIGFCNITVDPGYASLRVEATEAELKDLIVRARAALEDAKLKRRFDAGELTHLQFEAARLELDRTDFSADLT